MGIYQTWKPSHPCYLDWQKIWEGWPQWEWHRLEWCDIDGEVIGYMASCLHEIISKLRQGLSSKSSKNTADSLPSNRMPAWVISAIFSFFFQVGLGCNAQRFTSEWRCLGRLLVSFVCWCHGIKPHKKGWKRSCFSMQCNVRSYEDSFQKVLPGRWNKVNWRYFEQDECLGIHVFFWPRSCWMGNDGITTEWPERPGSVSRAKPSHGKNHSTRISWHRRLASEGGFVSMGWGRVARLVRLVWSDHSLGGWLSSRKIAQILKASYKDIWRTSNQ